MRRPKFGFTSYKLMLILQQVQPILCISVYQPFFHQGNTNHLQLFNMFTQSLNHMFPWPMCQQNRATSYQSPAEII